MSYVWDNHIIQKVQHLPTLLETNTFQGQVDATL